MAHQAGGVDHTGAAERRWAGRAAGYLAQFAPLYALLAALFWVAVVTWEVPIVGRYLGGDWQNTFYPAARLTLQGRVPYEAVVAFHPPHLFLLIAPMAGLGLQASAALWTALTMGASGSAVALLARRRAWVAVAVFLSLPTLYVVMNGQVTAVGVLALVVAFQALRYPTSPLWSGLGLTLLLAVPPDTVPLALWVAWRHLRAAQATVWKSLVLPLATAGATFLHFGWWVDDFVAAVARASATVGSVDNLSLWSHSPAPLLPMLLLVGVLGWTGRYRQALAQAAPLDQLWYFVAAGLLLTPYLLEHRLLMVYLVTCAALAGRHAGWVLLFWALSGLPLFVPGWLPFYLLPLTAFGLAALRLRHVRDKVVD